MAKKKKSSNNKKNRSNRKFGTDKTNSNTEKNRSQELDFHDETFNWGDVKVDELDNGTPTCGEEEIHSDSYLPPLAFTENFENAVWCWAIIFERDAEKRDGDDRYLCRLVDENGDQVVVIMQWVYEYIHPIIALDYYKETGKPIPVQLAHKDAFPQSYIFSVRYEKMKHGRKGYWDLEGNVKEPDKNGRCPVAHVMVKEGWFEQNMSPGIPVGIYKETGQVLKLDLHPTDFALAHIRGINEEHWKSDLNARLRNQLRSRIRAKRDASRIGKF